jgi:hypothetical protein
MDAKPRYLRPHQVAAASIFYQMNRLRSPGCQEYCGMADSLITGGGTYYLQNGSRDDKLDIRKIGLTVLFNAHQPDL